MQVVKYFRHEIKDGKTYISARPDLQMILGRGLWIDFQTEYGDVLDTIDSDDGGMVSASGVTHAQEAYDLLSFFGHEERLNAEVILEAEVELEDIDVYGRNDAIRNAEVSAGLNPELLREMVWVEGAEDIPGVMVLPQDDYNRVYVLEGSRDNPTVRFVPEKNEAGGVRPYYEKPGDGKTYIYVDGFSGGSGTQEDPYLIHDVHELQAMKNNFNAHYALAKDIDASDTANWNDGAGFEPIGNANSSFLGSFDGRGYKITGLYINRPSTNYVGLFGYSDGATIKNVYLVGGTIEGYSSTGGIVGAAASATISHCYNTGIVTGNDWRIGGVVGAAGASTIIQCYNTGSVTGRSHITGGIVGNCNSSNIIQCYNTGSVTGNESRTGGIAGSASNVATISQCYNTGSVTGSGDSIGGIVGSVTQNSNIDSCYWDTETSGVTKGVGQGSESGVFGKTTAEMMQQATYVGWDFDTVWQIDEGNDYPRLQWEEPPGPIYTELRAPGIVIGLRMVGMVAPGIVRGGIETVLVAPGIVQGYIDKPTVLVAPGIVKGLRMVGMGAPGIVQADVNIDLVAPGVVRGGIETGLVAPLQMDVRIRRRARVPLVVNPKIRRIRRWPLEISALFWRRVQKPPSLFGGD